MPSAAQWYEFWRLGDANLDGYINDKDLDFIQDYIGSWHPAADINEDGIVDNADMQIAAANYGLDIWSYFGISKPLEWWHWVLIGGGALVFFLLIAKVGRRKKED